MNENEIQRIAGAIGTLRPDWPIGSLTTFIRDKLANRPRRDVAVALTWVACESGTKTPARVLEAGPWWKATSADGESALRVPFDPRQTCATCSLTRAACETRWADDHEFVAVERKRAPGERPETVAVVHDGLCSHGVKPINCADHRKTATKSAATEETTNG